MKLALTCLFTVSLLWSFAQSDDSHSTSFIIQISSDQQSSIVEELSKSMNLDPDNISMRRIFEDDIFSLTLWPQHTIKKSSIEQLLHSNSKIRQFQRNLKAEWRREPNDPEFSIQNNLKLIGLDEAWNFTTGGLSPSGHEIVVAVVDDGFDVDHEDISGSIWVNRAEIPDNQIDDDDNGYIDDVIGINTRNDSGVHERKSHGTSVMGIVGAKGDNNIGIAGVMWDVKILLVSNIQFSDDIIEGFDYIREQRQRFNESDGREGAYIVANNYSGGVPNAFEEDQPILCDIINRLGEQGVVTVVSAPNKDVDIDIIGDLPADCSSEYMVVVTNTTVEEDEKFAASGFGQISVDMGAPGRGVTSIKPGNTYEPFGGTSASAPHVAGAISLLYSLPCTYIDSLSMRDPAGAAIFMKDLILTNTDQKPSLQGVTSTGGRLNVIKPIIAARDLCFDIPAEIVIKILPNPHIKGQPVIIDLLTPFLGEHVISIYSMAGDLIHSQTLSAPVSGRASIRLPDQLLSTHEGLFNVIVNTAEQMATSRFVIYNLSN